MLPFSFSRYWATQRLRELNTLQLKKTYAVRQNSFINLTTRGMQPSREKHCMYHSKSRCGCYEWTLSTRTWRKPMFSFYYLCWHEININWWQICWEKHHWLSLKSVRVTDGCKLEPNLHVYHLLRVPQKHQLLVWPAIIRYDEGDVMKCFQLCVLHLAVTQLQTLSRPPAATCTQRQTECHHH